MEKDLQKDAIRPSTALGYMAMAWESPILSDRLRNLVSIDFRKDDQVKSVSHTLSLSVQSQRAFSPLVSEATKACLITLSTSLRVMDC